MSCHSVHTGRGWNSLASNPMCVSLLILTICLNGAAVKATRGVAG